MEQNAQGFITSLEDHEVFVFGSNLAGNHAGGAAFTAAQLFGAVEGVGIGLQGQSYALPTLDANKQKLSLHEIEVHICALFDVASEMPDRIFYLTDIGTGIAGFTYEEIASVIRKVVLPLPKNIILHGKLADYIYIKGYKAFNLVGESQTMECREMVYEEGQTYTMRERPIPCQRGYHFCPKIGDVFNYYPNAPQHVVVHEVTATGWVEHDGDKCCTNQITIGRRLSWEEAYKLGNEGQGNSGFSNTGDSNTGDSNTGHRNTGHRNTGDSNTGDSNTGHRNTGHRNTGDSNTGDFNSGSGWSGYFCSGEAPVFSFGLPVDGMTHDEYRRLKGLAVASYHLRLVEWVWSYEMTDEEKKAHPEHETTGGCLRNRTLNEAWDLCWKGLPDEYKLAVMQLPNFTVERFKAYCGLDVAQDFARLVGGEEVSRG